MITNKKKGFNIKEKLNSTVYVNVLLSEYHLQSIQRLNQKLNWGTKRVGETNCETKTNDIRQV
ncbi:hypothetical protein BLOT_013919 [Blomia tropicalis]|nr:hypothetical protein BLOT_013919 [Blomia tropicalis]